VAAERRVSIEDPEMRHGRKSKSKRFNGYKRHIATDLDRSDSGLRRDTSQSARRRGSAHSQSRS
jgi:hypothetical protein